MHGGDGMFIRIKFQVNPFILIHLGLKSTPFFAKDWLCTKLTGIVILSCILPDCLRVITHCIVRSVFPADRKGRLMGPGDSQGIEINKESHGAFVVMETSICTWRYCHYIFIAFSPFSGLSFSLSLPLSLFLCECFKLFKKCALSLSFSLSLWD